MKCPDCGEMKMTHRVCLNCGSYDKRRVLEIIEKD